MTEARVQGAIARFLAVVLYFLISAYRYSFASIFGGQCRFMPNCSAYAIEAIETYGPFKGTRLAVNRLCRCHPWGGHGLDPVQQAESRFQGSND